MAEHDPGEQLDLFAVRPDDHVAQRRDAQLWPAQERFPVNRASRSVRRVLESDLATSESPLLVAGWSSIATLVDLLAGWDAANDVGTARVLLGNEPFASARSSFGDPRTVFDEQVRQHWHDRGFSLRLSARVVTVLRLLDDGRLRARHAIGAGGLHAKVYVSDDAATVGSSNLTRAGLQTQAEANARFTRADEPRRHDELRQIAENLWDTGQDWDDGLRALLEELLRVVPWREALARACAELLEGDWAEDLLARQSASLWPSQRAGVAQAMWIIENVGSVLVADATGSGKTRMGAHLVRSVRERLWSTGRMRRDLTALVCPPAVQEAWNVEAVRAGVSLTTISHGRLSRASDQDDPQRSTVTDAQLLAVDEAHNFLNASANRTQLLRQNLADHVVLFTATPISRGASDLLDLVALLGPDNFDDETHEILREVQRGRLHTLEAAQAARLRREVQRFTLRRTKGRINALVDEEPEAYLHPRTGRVCRYPEHVPNAYPTGETEADEVAANRIRELAAELTGVALLPSSLEVPASLRARVDGDRWVQFRLRSAAGLAAHQVLAALRSSRPALREHVHGTAAAATAHDIDPGFKQGGSGDRVAACRVAGLQPPPDLPGGLAGDHAPPWLADEAAWRAVCEREAQTYEQIGRWLDDVSDARERAKLALLRRLAAEHGRVLAFDRHLITLALLHRGLQDDPDVHEVLLATGQARTARRRVERLFAPDAPDGARVVALCSDAMNEGINLQGASAMVHLDLPTTLRVAEQRVGRVDRMDSPHDSIAAWWPADGPAFATRARERFVERLEESGALLGRNLPVPDLGTGSLPALDDDATVDPHQVHEEVEEALAAPDDGIDDALEPVRHLVHGPDALVARGDYLAHRTTRHRVLARVAPVASTRPWAFLSVRTSLHGAPRWMLVDPASSPTCETDLRLVVDRLRQALAGDPEDRPVDGRAEQP